MMVDSARKWGGQIRYSRLDLDQSGLDHGGDVETMSVNRQAAGISVGNNRLWKYAKALQLGRR